LIDTLIISVKTNLCACQIRHIPTWTHSYSASGGIWYSFKQYL